MGKNSKNTILPNNKNKNLAKKITISFHKQIKNEIKHKNNNEIVSKKIKMIILLYLK